MWGFRGVFRCYGEGYIPQNFLNGCLQLPFLRRAPDADAVCVTNVFHKALQAIWHQSYCQDKTHIATSPVSLQSPWFDLIYRSLSWALFKSVLISYSLIWNFFSVLVHKICFYKKKYIRLDVIPLYSKLANKIRNDLNLITFLRSKPFRITSKLKSVVSLKNFLLSMYCHFTKLKWNNQWGRKT